MGPGDLRAILGSVGRAGVDPSVLVGTETGDDAGVYRVRDDLALVLTTDFITPVCDDPNLFGQVAAANSLSDVFAMGGRPVAALAVCGFPEALRAGDAREILAGGAAKAAEAGAAVLGGHTVRNPELLYGLAVTGTVHPDKIVRNSGARVGDALVLTKPLGTGLLINGARQGKLDDERLVAACRRMAELNRTASEAMVEAGAHAATDVTGFGLAGHGLGMARATGVSLRVRAGALPLYDHALDMQRAGVRTKSTRSNQESYQGFVHVVPGVSDDVAAILFDPQTAGGLLIAIDGDAADRLVGTLRDRGVQDAIAIGEVVAADGEPSLEMVA